MYNFLFMIFSMFKVRKTFKVYRLVFYPIIIIIIELCNIL